MTQTTALEFQRKFGEFQHQAQREPVEITRHGRREFVLMSAEHYDRLAAAAQRLHGATDAAAIVIDAVERAEVDPAYSAPGVTADGRFPMKTDRDYEERLAGLCASRTFDRERWRRAGPGFFMAGIAVMAASASEFDRRALLELAEDLHAGSSQVGVFALWLKDSPVRPSRFLPMAIAAVRHAA